MSTVQCEYVDLLRSIEVGKIIGRIRSFSRGRILVCRGEKYHVFPQIVIILLLLFTRAFSKFTLRHYIQVVAWPWQRQTLLVYIV